MARVTIDIATSGLDPKIHSILEIALIKTDDSYNVIDKLSMRIKHKNLVVSPEAVAFNGLDLREAVDWTDETTARDAICRFLTGGATYTAVSTGTRVPRSTYVGLGAAKDMMYLVEFLGPYVYDALFYPRLSDIGTLFEAALIAGLVPHPASGSLLDIARASGIDVPEIGSHSAINDAMMARDTARALFVLLKEAGQRSRGETVCSGF